MPPDGTATRPTAPPAPRARRTAIASCRTAAAVIIASANTGMVSCDRAPAAASAVRRSTRSCSSSPAFEVGVADPAEPAASMDHGPVADGLDSADQLLGRDARLVRDGSPFERVVDGGGDAGQLVEPLLDARRARGARHASSERSTVFVELSSSASGRWWLRHDVASSALTVNAAVRTSPPASNCRNSRYAPADGNSASNARRSSSAWTWR